MELMKHVVDVQDDPKYQPIYWTGKLGMNYPAGITR